MRIMGLESIAPKPNTSVPRKDHTVYPYLLRGLNIDGPNQVWATDITYVPMERGHLYLVAVIDWWSRKVLSWRLSNSLDTRFCVDALEEAFSLWGMPRIFNTDQGAQFTSLGEKPYDAKAPVVCLGEKPVSLHAEVRPSRPARPGHLAKRDNEHKRCGRANVFGIVEPKAGRHLTCATHDHFGPLAGRAAWRRLTVHYTPKHGSCSNQAETELSMVSRQCLGRRRIADLRALQAETRAWTARANRRKTRINWRFTRKDARRKFSYKTNLSKRCLPEVLGAGRKYRARVGLSLIPD